MRTEVANWPPTVAWSSARNFVEGAMSVTAALIVSVAVARTLGPERFGLYALVMALVSFTYVFAQLGVPATVCRYAAELDGRGQRKIAAAVTGRGLRMAFFSGLAATLLLSMTAVPLADLFHQPSLRLYLLIGAARIVPMIGVGVFRGLLRGMQQYQFLLRLNLHVAPLWLAGCAFALWVGAGVAGVLAATFAAEVINLLVLGWKAHRHVGIRWTGRLPDSLRQRLVRYNWALAAIVVINVIVWQRSELLFLGRFSGPLQVAYYAVPFAITSRVGDLLPGAVLGVLIPGLAYAQGASDQTRFNVIFGEALRYVAMLTLPICLFCIPLAPTIIAVLYGTAFVPAAIILQILLVSMVFTVLGQASQSALLGAESQGWLVKTGLAAALLSIGLDLLLIPRWGAVGAAIANTIVQAAWAMAISIPLWERTFAFTRRAVVKVGVVAGALAAFLSLFVVVGSATVTLAAVGITVLTIYGLALYRLNMFRPMPAGVLVGN